MAHPTITVIIPTYSRPLLLRRALQSVLTQTYPHLKVLVSDNASGDATKDVVDELRARDSRIVYHCHPTNLGDVANFRFAMDAVDTEYFSILADDDLLLPDFFRYASEAFEAHPAARFFCGQIVQYDNMRGVHSLRPRARWREGFHEAGRSAPLMTDNFFIWTSCVFSSDVRTTLGPIDSSAVTDVIYMVTAAAHFPFVVTLVPCAVMEYHGENEYFKMTAAILRESHEAMHERCGALPNLMGDERRQVSDNIDRHFRLLANGLLRTALEAGDRQRIEDLSSFLEERGGLTGKRRVRAALARHSMPMRWLVSRMTRLSAGYKRMRRSYWGRSTLDEVVARYSAGTTAAGE